MAQGKDEEGLLRSVALQNAQSILLARQRAEEELVRAKEALELRSQELARTIAMMRATLESSTDGILVTDDDGSVMVFNEKFVEMWRIPREVLDTRDHRQVLEVTCRAFDDPQRFLARIDEIYASPPPDSYDLLELTDGRVLERFSRIQFVEERDVGRVWTFRDITDRRRAQSALERERARLEEETQTLETINRMSEAIAAELNLDRLVQTLTDEATKLTGAHFGSFFYNVTGEHGESFMLYTISGVPREAFAGFPMPRNTQIFDPTFKGAGIVRIDDVTKDPRYGKNPPYNGMPEGHLPVRSYLAVPVISRSEEVIGGLFFGHPDAGVFTESNEHVLAGIAAQAAIAVDNARLFDALEREKDTAESARERAEAANRAKDEFLAMISHELRTPLNSMLGWMRLIRSGRLDDETLTRGLETIERNTLSQAQLIEDLLDISRVITGKLSLVVEQVEVDSVIQTAVDSVRLAAEARDIHLQMILDSSAGVVSGDRGRLQQVIWNLLSNAIKFTPKGGKVRIQLERVSSSVEITVSDSGKGISPEFLPYVFERFRQADAGITRTHGGLGLGLSIVRHLVELHGGTVRAESEGEDKGATFVVRLPVAPVRRGRAKAQGPRTHTAPIGGFDCPPELTGVRVLVVDDEADTRSMLAVVLGQCEADVRTASSASEALATLDAHDGWRPDLLVSDIGMPDEDGYSLIKKIRERPTEQGGSIPAVALTAYARLEDRMQALAAGFQIHVAKPVEPAELILVIRSLLDFKGRT